MGSIADAFNKVGIKPTDFTEVKVDAKKIEWDMQIEFLEKWLKLIERNAPAKERYNFVTKHGFLSEKHLNLFLACSDDLVILQYRLEDCDITGENKAELEKEIKEKETLANNIRNIHYYRIIMRQLGQKDISPYGVDLLRFKPAGASSVCKVTT